MKVYHFLSADYAIQDLAMKRIRVSRFADLNDPFELLGAAQTEKRIRKQFAEFKHRVHEAYGMLCFSKTWHEPTMWSHYGDKHRGIVIGFEVPEDSVVPVKYTKLRLSFSIEDLSQLKRTDRRLVKRLVQQKYQAWSYEQEQRRLVRLDECVDDSSNHFVPFADNLRVNEVILGDRCQLPIGKVKEFISTAFDEVYVIKSRLAFKTYTVTENRTVTRST